MLRMRNKYCSNCLSTQRFLDLGSHLVCERCSKRLYRIAPENPAGNVIGVFVSRSPEATLAGNQLATDTPLAALVIRKDDDQPSGGGSC